MDNNRLEKYPSFSQIRGYFLVRKYGIFGKGIKFNFSVAALMTVRPRPRIMRFVRGYVKAEVEMRFEAEPPGDNIRIELHTWN